MELATVERTRFLTEEEKVHELALFERYKAEPRNWRRENPDAKGGEGFIDHEILPLCDELNQLAGVCTIQSCCGHVNKHGYQYPGQLWIRLSAGLSGQFDARVAELLRSDVIQHITKLYSFQDGSAPHEVIDLKFWGEPQGRMAEAHAVIAAFFWEMGK
jgi:hypothetical protein